MDIIVVLDFWINFFGYSRTHLKLRNKTEKSMEMLPKGKMKK
jgi:hypothetical protein